MSIILRVLFFILPLQTLAVAQVTVINNPEEAPVKVAFEMDEVWRAGANEDEDFMFGVIGEVLRDKDGNLYFLDTQQNEIFKFSPDGRYLKSITRNGEGPGEISLCYFCDFWSDSAMGCLNIFPQGFVRFDLEGTPLSSLKTTPLPDLGSEETISLFKFTRRDGFMVSSGRHFMFENGESTQIEFLSSFDEDVNEVHRFAQNPTGYNFRKPITVDEDADFIPYSSWALGSQGEVYLAPGRTGFLIEVRDCLGNLKREIHRQWHPEKRNKEEKSEAKNQWSFSTNGDKLPEISYKISDFPTTIMTMQWIDQNLWVTTSKTIKKSKVKQIQIVDVFDKEGHLLEERSFNLPFDSDKDQIHWLDGGRVVVVKNIKSARFAAQDSDIQVQIGDSRAVSEDDEDSILEVILYRVKG